jgi:F-type H+-transporting ATPase subunit epsilon
MTPGTLTLEIVTPDGTAVRETAVDVVVLRRREEEFEAGSEVAVFPRHGPLLVRLPVAPLRYRRAAETFHLAVGGGFAEVLRDRVLVVTPRVERISDRGRPAPIAAATLCRGWRAEAIDSREGLAGYR